MRFEKALGCNLLEGDHSMRRNACLHVGIGLHMRVASEGMSCMGCIKAPWTYGWERVCIGDLTACRLASYVNIVS